MIIKQLQRATLQSQGLRSKQPFGKGKKAVLAAIEHLGYIQIDTLAVVERAHHHTLWTRISDYKTEYLNQLVEESKVFEYWFHAASYLPMRDFRYALPQMLQFKSGETRYYKNVDPKTLNYVIDKIKIDGPQKARDFKTTEKRKGSWWNWKPAKVALEKLFMQGDLMICGRNGMEKIYDLTERILPNTIDTTEPSPMEFAEYLVNTYFRAYGFTTLKQITHLKTGRILRKNVEHVLRNMIEEQTVKELKIDGLPRIFALRSIFESKIKKSTPKIHLLSPFDNSIIHRDRIEQIFNYDFRIECYLPKEKRQYGYFCLPILFGDEFIGRVDCKAHRNNGLFEIIHLHLDKRLNDLDYWLDPFIKALKDFAAFNSCKSIKVSKVSPANITGILQGALNFSNTMEIRE